MGNNSQIYVLVPVHGERLLNSVFFNGRMQIITLSASVSLILFFVTELEVGTKWRHRSPVQHEREPCVFSSPYLSV